MIRAGDTDPDITTSPHLVPLSVAAYANALEDDLRGGLPDKAEAALGSASGLPRLRVRFLVGVKQRDPPDAGQEQPWLLCEAAANLRDFLRAGINSPGGNELPVDWCPLPDTADPGGVYTPGAPPEPGVLYVFFLSSPADILHWCRMTGSATPATAWPPHAYVLVATKQLFVAAELPGVDFAAARRALRSRMAILSQPGPPDARFVHGVDVTAGRPSLMHAVVDEMGRKVGAVLAAAAAASAAATPAERPAAAEPGSRAL